VLLLPGVPCYTIIELGPGPASDMRVLQALYAANPRPIYNSNVWWNESKPVTEWYGVDIGVDCADAGRVVGITLFGGLTSVPAPLWGLTALRTLDLRRNKLTSLPAEIGNLTALETLNLRMNQLTSVPAQLGRLTALRTLLLYGNDLTSVPAELGNLTALQTLNLGSNKLTSVPAELGNLTALETLNLGGNYKLTSVPAELGRLPALQSLVWPGIIHVIWSF